LSGLEKVVGIVSSYALGVTTSVVLITECTLHARILSRTRNYAANFLRCTMPDMFKPKTTEQWLLFKYIGLEFTPLSKPFKTKEQAEKARMKYPERQRKTIGLG